MQDKHVILQILDYLAQSKVIQSITNGSLLAAFGASINYLYNEIWLLNKRLNLITVFIVCILGFFVGNVIDPLLPSDWEYRSTLFFIAGFSFNPILAMIEKTTPKLLIKHVNKVLKVDISEKKDTDNVDSKTDK